MSQTSAATSENGRERLAGLAQNRKALGLVTAHPMLLPGFGLIAVLLVSLRFLTGYTEIFALPISSDSFSFSQAHLLFQGEDTIEKIRMLSPDWGPLYVIWLWLLHHVDPRPISMFLNNAISLYILVGVALYAYLVRTTRRTALSVLIVTIWQASAFNFATHPKMTAFGLLLVIAAMLLASLPKRAAAQMMVAALGLWLCAFVRPEMILSFGIALTAGIVLLIREGMRPAWSSLAATATTSFAVLLGTALWGVPALEDETNRSGMALEHHFAINWLRWQNDPHSALDQGAQIWDRVFGEADGLTSALAAAPGQLLHHFASNLSQFGWQTPRSAFWHEPVLLSPASGIAYEIEYFAVSLLLFGLAVWALKSKAARDNLRRHGRMELFKWMAVLAGTTAAAVMIYPRSHYLMFSAVGLLAIASIVIAPRLRLEQPKTGVSIAVILLCVALTPRPYTLPTAHHLTWAEISVQRPTIAAIDAFQSLGLPQDRRLRVMTFHDGMYYFLGPHVHEVRSFAKGDTLFARFMAERRLDAVIVNVDVREHRNFAEDPTWRDFVNRPDRYGFRRAVAAPAVTIYIDTDLPCRRPACAGEPE